MTILRRSFLIGLVVALALVGAACSGANDTVGAGKGQVRISLSSASGTAAAATAAGTGAAVGTTAGGSLVASHDDDSDDHGRSITAAAVTFSSILARNLDGQLIPITSALPVTVDLMTILTGGQVQLPVGTLPPGDYDQLVVVMTKVELTLTDGTKIAITPPGGGWTAIVPTAPFTVLEGATTALELQLHRGAFQFLDGKFKFDPRFDCRRH